MITTLIDYFYYMLYKLKLDIIGFEVEIKYNEIFEIILVNYNYNVCSSMHIQKIHIFNDETYNFNIEILNETLYYLLVNCFEEVLL